MSPIFDNPVPPEPPIHVQSVINLGLLEFFTPRVSGKPILMESAGVVLLRGRLVGLTGGPVVPNTIGEGTSMMAGVIQE
jgi:hypothetical protein